MLVFYQTSNHSPVNKSAKIYGKWLDYNTMEDIIVSMSMRMRTLVPLIITAFLCFHINVRAQSQNDNLITLSLNSNKTINIHDRFNPEGDFFLPKASSRPPNNSVVPMFSTRYVSTEGLRFAATPFTLKHEFAPRGRIVFDQSRYPVVKDILGNPAGGKIPVINYRRDLIDNSVSCPELPTEWRSSYERDPIVGADGLKIPDNIEPCHLQEALDAAVAVVRFHPTLHHFRDMLSPSFVNEWRRYQNAGLLYDLDVLLEQLDFNPIAWQFYSLKEAPLFLIVAAYPNMNVYSYRDYAVISPREIPFDTPLITFYFYLVSPSGYVCGMVGYGYNYNGLGCFDMLEYVPKIQLSVIYDYDIKKWRLYTFDDGSYDPSILMRMNKIENRDVGQAYPSGYYNALAFYYPPIREWFKDIEEGRRHRINPEIFKYPINTYAFAPGYGLMPMNPLSATHVDLSKPITIPANLLNRFIFNKNGISETLALLTLINDKAGQLVRTRDVRYMPNISVIITTTKIMTPQDKLVDVFKYTTSNDALLLQETYYGDDNKPINLASLHDYSENKIYDIRLDGSGKKAIACTLREVRPYMFQPITLYESYYTYHNHYIDSYEIKDGNLIIYEKKYKDNKIGVEYSAYQVLDKFKSKQIFRQDILFGEQNYKRMIQVLERQSIEDIVKLCRQPSPVLDNMLDKIANVSGINKENLLVLEWKRENNKIVAFSGLSFKNAEASIIRNINSSSQYKILQLPEKRWSGLRIIEVGDVENNRLGYLTLHDHDLIMPDGKLISGVLIEWIDVEK
ncbi:MAG: hypothetical protein NZM04_08015 [Methylacidiphilales bacterium]|nr:hypothetical protein [Candidatus Methylacidiphilales bacterium]